MPWLLPRRFFIDVVLAVVAVMVEALMVLVVVIVVLMVRMVEDIYTAMIATQLLKV